MNKIANLERHYLLCMQLYVMNSDNLKTVDTACKRGVLTEEREPGGSLEKRCTLYKGSYDAMQKLRITTLAN
jgi:hypothetical protein